MTRGAGWYSALVSYNLIVWGSYREPLPSSLPCQWQVISGTVVATAVLTCGYEGWDLIVVFSLSTRSIPIEICKDHLYTSLPHIEKDYFVSLDVKATSFINDWQNIIHFTPGGKMEKYGDRTPAIFFDSDGKLEIHSAINGNSDYYYIDPVQR